MNDSDMRSFENRAIEFAREMFETYNLPITIILRNGTRAAVISNDDPRLAAAALVGPNEARVSVEGDLNGETIEAARRLFTGEKPN